MGDWREFVEGRWVFFLVFCQVVGNVGLTWFDGEGEVLVLVEVTIGSELELTMTIVSKTPNWCKTPIWCGVHQLGVCVLE